MNEIIYIEIPCITRLLVVCAVYAVKVIASGGHQILLHLIAQTFLNSISTLFVRLQDLVWYPLLVVVDLVDVQDP